MRCDVTLLGELRRRSQIMFNLRGGGGGGGELWDDMVKWGLEVMERLGSWGGEESWNVACEWRLKANKNARKSLFKGIELHLTRMNLSALAYSPQKWKIMTLEIWDHTAAPHQGTTAVFSARLFPLLLQHRNAEVYYLNVVTKPACGTCLLCLLLGMLHNHTKQERAL